MVLPISQFQEFSHVWKADIQQGLGWDLTLLPSVN